MKYKLTDETREIYGRTLHRIQALKDFGRVSKGDIGGWIEKKSNLSQEGTCWVVDNAHVFGNAYVCGNAQVYDDAEVYGNARVYDNVHVSGAARVSGSARVSGDAQVYGNADVSSSARVCGDAQVFKNMTCTLNTLTCDLTRGLITVSDKHIAIGCEVHTFDHWLEGIETIGKENRYSEEDIKLYKQVVTSLIERRRS